MSSTSPPSSRLGDPPWEIALLFPSQGSWSETDYLELHTNRLVELSDGCLEVLPTPTVFHQLIVKFLCAILEKFVSQNVGGQVLFAPLPVRLGPGKYREPDVVYLQPGRLHSVHGQPEGADLVMEVVSEGAENRRRDLVIKREEYAQAGIKEYWIVDPQPRQIQVWILDGDQYRLHGEFAESETASSVLLPGISVPVKQVLDSGSEL